MVARQTFGALIATAVLACSVAGACASGEDVPSGSGGSGNLSGSAGGDASAGAGGTGGTGAGQAGSATGGGAGEAGSGPGPDAGNDAADGSSGAAGSGGSGGSGDNESCPGELVTLTGSPTLKATISGGTPPKDDSAGSCNSGAARDAVYRLVAPVDGVLTVQLSTTAFDGVLYVRDECASTASEIACENSAATNGTEKIVLYAKSGEDYFVFADGVGPTAAGLFALQFELAPAQPVDSCPGEVVTWTGSGTQDRTAQLSNSSSGLWPNDSASCSAGSSAAPDGVYELTPDVDGILTLELSPSGYDGVLSLRSDCANASSEIACANAAGASGKETVEVWATNGSKLWAMVDGTAASSSGSYTLDAVLSPEKPDEKCPGQTATLSGQSPMTWSVVGDTSKRWPDFTLNCAPGSSNARDVVYALTVPATGELTVTLKPQFWDAVLGVRTSCSSGGAEQCVDQPGASAFDSTTFVATGGTTYHFIVDAKQAAAGGVFTLEASLLPFPEADGCPGKLIALSGNSGQVSDDLSLFYPDYTASCAQVTSAKDAVYRVVAPKTGNMNVVLAPQGFDAALYVKDACTAAATLACGDANGPGFSEFATVAATQGATYWLIVDSATTTAGPFTLSVSFP